MPQTHDMFQVGLAERGEEWRCESCSRRILVNWRPEWRSIVLEPGDTTAWHAGSAMSQVLAARVDDPVTAHERAWLHDTGIDWDDGDA
jgi:hypothetical protein